MKGKRIPTGINRLAKDLMAQVNNESMKRWDLYQHDNPNAVYKNVDHDEFPIAHYMFSRTGFHVSAVFSTPSIQNSIVCHYPEDLNSVIKDFGFSKVHVVDTYDEDEKSVISQITYEKIEDSSIVMMRTSGVPNDWDEKKNSKLKRKKVRAILLGAGDLGLYEKVKKSLIEKYRKVKHEENYVNLVIATQGGYDTQEFDLPKQTVDIPLNYGDSFVKVHEKILKSLNSPNSKGLVLLHGDPGTGKTHYLKYLASKIKGKKVLFIPPYLADFITSPEMTPFLIENSNSILFIEDAERVITDRNENGGTGVSNILNITDGILSDILKIQIVATFNMDKKKIDPALLRKGRLIAEHKFGPLSVDESNRLLKKLGTDHKAHKEMTLTEIYNFKDTHYVSEESSGPRRIGFGTN